MAFNFRSYGHDTGYVRASMEVYTIFQLINTIQLEVKYVVRVNGQYFHVVD